MGLIRYIRNQIRHDRNIKQKLDSMTMDIHSLYNEMGNRYRLVVLSRKKDWLTDKVMSCADSGITDERHCGEEVVVSLTSFGKRINEVYLSIESIMQGTIKPNLIVLWLAEDEFRGKILPQTLQRQQKRGLQIEYCEDIRSYKKIVPAMKKYPDACIVTIDDDVIYEFDLLENLLNAHVANPEDVCACRIHHITIEDDKKPKSYMQWQWQVWPEDKSNFNFLTGVGGCLYPPRCFVKEFLNKEAFMSLCPYADDVWINAMVWMSGRQITKVYTHSKTGCDYTESYIEQEDALCKENTNVLNCRNDVQIKAVMDRYDLYQYLDQV